MSLMSQTPWSALVQRSGLSVLAPAAGVPRLAFAGPPAGWSSAHSDHWLLMRPRVKIRLGSPAPSRVWKMSSRDPVLAPTHALVMAPGHAAGRFRSSAVLCDPTM